MNINKIISHKYFHYTAIALMIFNIIGYVSIQSMECVLVFGAASYAANHFTKNRALDIFIGLFVANVLFGCGRVKEGFVKANTNVLDMVKDTAAHLDDAVKCADDEKSVGDVCVKKEALTEACKKIKEAADVLDNVKA
jgi:hypothetical protein